MPPAQWTTTRFSNGCATTGADGFEGSRQAARLFFGYSVVISAPSRGLTQTVTQTRKNQVELSVLETTKLRNFLSRKVRKCLEISAKNIRPTFGNRNLPHLTRQRFYWFSATATMQQPHCLTAISHSFKIYCACRLLTRSFWRIICTRSVGF